MKTLSGQERAGVLESHRWTLLRVHGSHHIYGKSGSEIRLSVPVHAKRPLKKGLQRHLMKMAGIDEADL